MLQAVPGIVETSPGVRSCMIEYDQRVLPLRELLSLLEATERALPSVRTPAAQTLRGLWIHSTERVRLGPFICIQRTIQRVEKRKSRHKAGVRIKHMVADLESLWATCSVVHVKP